MSDDRTMARDLPSTPEGALIRRTRQSIKPRLTIPAAAQLASMSAETWGHMERGYKAGLHGSPPTKFTPSAQILAHAAFAIGVTPADLEQVDRVDAAEVLTKMISAAHPPDELEADSSEIDNGRVFFLVPKGVSMEDRDRIRRWAEKLAEEFVRNDGLDEHGD